MGKREKKLPLSCCCATRGNTVLCAKKCLLMLLLFFIHKSQLFQNDHIKYLFLSGLIWLPLWMMPGAGWGAGPRRCLGNGWRGWGWLRMRCWTGGRCLGLCGDWGCCLRPWSYDHQNPENRGTERLEMVGRVSPQKKRNWERDHNWSYYAERNCKPTSMKKAGLKSIIHILNVLLISNIITHLYLLFNYIYIILII